MTEPMTEQTLNVLPSGSNPRQPEAGLTPEAGVRVNGLDEPSVTIQTEKLGGQRRRILAHTDLPFAAEQLWQILTDYDNLSSFIPNLSYSQRLGHPGGGIRLEQMGSQCFLQVKFCARVVLDMVEAFPQRISFSMVEGDFREFEGEWTLESLGEGQRPLTCLGYALLVRPPRGMPAGLIERHIRHDLTRNLKAIGDRAGVLFSG